MRNCFTRHSTRLTAAAIALQLLGCERRPDAPAERAPIFTTSEEVVLSARDDQVLASVSSILIWHDRLVVVDRQEANVKVYDPRDGGLLRVIGHKGDGPGEFRLPESAVVAPDGHLAVLDLIQARITFFDTAGAYANSWSIPGSPMGGLGMTEAGTVYVSARMVSDDGSLEPDAVHMFTVDGEPLGSLVELPEPTHFGEGNYNGVMLAVIGDRAVTLSHTSNAVRIDTLGGSKVDTVLVGGSFYHPVEWSLEPGATPKQASDWTKDQLLAWHLVPVADCCFGVGFQTFDRTLNEWTYRWALAGVTGETVLESGPTDVMLGPLYGGFLLAIRIKPNGDAVLLRERVRWTATRLRVGQGGEAADFPRRPPTPSATRVRGRFSARNATVRPTRPPPSPQRSRGTQPGV